jgi:PAS domain S-box-containing protein
MGAELVKTGIHIVGDVPWGTHFCQFYQTKDDLIDILVPYFKAGLENNEFCMWVTAGPLSGRDARKAMVNAMPAFDKYTAREQIEIVPYTEWYLEGGAFNQARVLNGWVDKLDQALAKGYAGMRLSGNTFWLEKEDWESFIDYEAAINDFIGGHKMLALCTYSLDKCGAAEILDVVRNHEFALIKRSGEWQLIESAVYRQTKEALAQSEERFRSIYEESPIGIQVYDSQGTLITANKACLDIFGVSDIKEVKGFKLFEDPNVTDETKRRLRSGETVRFEAFFDFEKVKRYKLYDTSKSGTIYLDVLITPLGRGETHRGGYLVHVQDITERKRMEDALRKGEMQLRRITEEKLRSTESSFRRVIASSADGVVVVDTNGIVRYVNPASEALFGRSAGEMVGSSFGFPLRETADIEIVRGKGERAVAEMRAVQTEWEGQPVYLATLRDITRRKRGMERLQQSENRLRLLLDQTPCVSWTTDTQLRFTSSQGAGLAALKLHPDEVVGMTLSEYFKVDESDFVAYVAHRRALEGIPSTYELDWDGRTFYSRVEPLRDIENCIVGVVGIALDITERKQAEEELQALSHRLVSLQEDERRKIAGELHDQIGQSLTALKLSLDRISASGSERGNPELREAQAAVKDLMARVRNMSLDLWPTMLDDLGLLPTLLWHFKRYTAQTHVHVNFKHAGLQRDLPADIISVAYRIVQEALTNVARHARVDEVLVCVRAEHNALIVEIKDQGIGFDPDIVSATGVGLHSMRERALSLNGKLLIQSSPGSGTCLIAELPSPIEPGKRKREKPQR